MTSQLEDISTTAEQLSSSANEVASTVTTIAAGMGKLSNYTEAVLHSMDEQTASMQAVNHVTQDLSVQADHLQKLTNQFRV